MFFFSKDAGLDNLPPLKIAYQDLILLEYRKLHECDKENAALSRKGLKKCLSEKSGIGKEQKAGLRNVSLVGSCFEGTLLAKCFKPTELGFNNEIECDIEFNLMEITEEFKDMVEDLEGKIGYVRLTVDRRMITFSREAGWEVNDEDFNKYIPSGYLDESNHLRTNVIKEEILRRVQFEKVDEYVQLMAAAVLGQKFEDVEISRQKQVITKSSIENSLHVLIKNDLKFKISWDFVVVIKLSWWPKIANEWITRTREWPNEYTVKKLSGVSYIVIKSSDEEKYNPLSTELRYSFTHTEGELMALRTEQQKFVYFIFKCMFYKWLKPLDETKLHSFIVKTVMFWSCERFPPNHDLWKDDAESVCLALEHLFERLKSAIEEDFLSYYFIREINVLSEIEGDLKIKVLKQINLILSDVKGHIMLDIASILAFGREVVSLGKKLLKLVEKISNGRYNKLLAYPKLYDKFVQIKAPLLNEQVAKGIEKITDKIDKTMLPHNKLFRSDVGELYTKTIAKKGLELSEGVSEVIAKDISTAVEDFVDQSYFVIEFINKANSTVKSKFYDNKVKTAIDVATNISCNYGIGIAAACVDFLDHLKEPAQSITEARNIKKE